MTIATRQSAADRFQLATIEVEDLRKQTDLLDRKRNEALRRQSEARTELEKTVGPNIPQRVFQADGAVVVVTHRTDRAAEVTLQQLEPRD